MLKQLLVLIVSLALAFSLFACGSESDLQDGDSVSASSIEPSLDKIGEVVESSPNEEILSSEKLIVEPESKTESIIKTETQEETAFSIAPSAETSLSAVVPKTPSTVSDSSVAVYYDTAAVDDFYGNSVEELIDWIESNEQSAIAASVSLASNAQATYTGTNSALQSLLVPVSVKESLTSGSIVITKGSNACVYRFQTNESENNNENEHYSVRVAPLTAEEAQKDLTELYYPGKTIAKGTYQGIEYAYQDGYEGTDQSDRAFASAWFIQNGCVIKITAHWINAYKPWNNEWFDYFDFETITF